MTTCNHPVHYYPESSKYDGDPCYCGQFHIPQGEGIRHIEVTSHSDLVRRYVNTIETTDLFGKREVIQEHYVVSLPKPIGFWQGVWLYLMECW